jgi:hypothetical protein
MRPLHVYKEGDDLRKRTLAGLALAVSLTLGVAFGGSISARGDDTPITTTDTSTTTSTSSETATAPSPEELAALHKQVVKLRQGLKWQRQMTWYWQYSSFVPRSPSSSRELSASSAEYLKWRVRIWSARRERAKRYAQHPPHLAEWQCLYRYEHNGQPEKGPTGWASHTGNGYDGGLQMDIDFQRAHGSRFLFPRGPNGPMVTANHWTRWQQMWTGENALREGVTFYAWPNTARFCGII